MYIGSGNSHSGSVSYMLSTVGIIGKSTANAIVVDGGTGPVDTFNFQCTRVNPVSYSDPGITPGNTNDYTNCSNAFFRKKIKAMRETIQMENNAYVLRIYNLSQRSHSDTAEHKNTVYSTPLELYVFLNTCTDALNSLNPLNLDVNINLTMRAKLLAV